MTQEEFNNFKKIKYEKSPFVQLYELDDGSSFFVEPNFYGQLIYLKNLYHKEYKDIFDELIANVKRNKKVIFTADYENPVVHEDNYIYQEMEDILNKLNIDTGFISFGSEYGD